MRLNSRMQLRRRSFNIVYLTPTFWRSCETLYQAFAGHWTLSLFITMYITDKKKKLFSCSSYLSLLLGMNWSQSMSTRSLRSAETNIIGCVNLTACLFDPHSGYLAMSAKARALNCCEAPLNLQPSLTLIFYLPVNVDAEVHVLWSRPPMIDTVFRWRLVSNKSTRSL